MSTISSYDEALDFFPETKSHSLTGGKLTAKLRVLWEAMSEANAAAYRYRQLIAPRRVGRRGCLAGVRRVLRGALSTSDRMSKTKGGCLALSEAPPCIREPRTSGGAHALRGLQPALDLLDIRRIAVAQQALAGRGGGIGQHVGA